MSESVYFYRERLKACEEAWENHKKYRDETLQEDIEEPKHKQECTLDEGLIYDYVRDMQADGYEFY